jgi:enamine deaminase RidA (YjgF/YER057c/UK114 family)
VPFVQTGNLLFVTGQLSQWNGERRFIGKLGREFGVEEGQQAARLCALNVIAQLQAALDGELDRVVRCVRIAGFVNSVPEFHDQSQVMNGASDIIVEIFEAAATLSARPRISDAVSTQEVGTATAESPRRVFVAGARLDVVTPSREIVEELLGASGRA